MLRKFFYKNSGFFSTFGVKKRCNPFRLEFVVLYLSLILRPFPFPEIIGYDLRIVSSTKLISTRKYAWFYSSLFSFTIIFFLQFFYLRISNLYVSSINVLRWLCQQFKVLLLDPPIGLIVIKMSWQLDLFQL